MQIQTAQSFLDPSLLLLVGFLVLMYFFIIRPQNRRAKEQREMLASLSVGDEIITNGGLVGVIVELSEQFAIVDVGEKVRVRVQRAAVATLLPKGTVKAS